jgi:hypothetical protein
LTSTRTTAKPALTSIAAVESRPGIDMVRRRSTVRFSNGVQVDDLIRKDSNRPSMPVGTNGCHQGTQSSATASPERPYPQGTALHPAGRKA